MEPIRAPHKHTIGAIAKEIYERHDAGIISYTSLPHFTSLYLIISYMILITITVHPALTLLTLLWRYTDIEAYLSL